jgi:hypothetical protein
MDGEATRSTGNQLAQGWTTAAEAARRHGKVAEVEEWRDRFLLERTARAAEEDEARASGCGAVATARAAFQRAGISPALGLASG